MTEHSELNTQQPYNRAGEQPTTTRPVMQSESPYASTRGSMMSKQLPAFDEAIINKYNRSGPRYTSYPTALEFSPISDGLEAKILQNREARAPLSLYFHIPFCRRHSITALAIKLSPRKIATQAIICSI